MLRGVMQFVRRAVQSGGMVPWVALWTVLFVLVNRAPILGRAMPIWDARDSFFPFFVLTADHARAGRIVAWDVWSNGGLPRIGDPEFGAVWPLQLLVGLVSGGTPAGFIAYWMIVWWLGGLGMFLLARHLRAPPWAAFVVVSGYTWSGLYTGHAEHISWLVGFSSLPFVIWRLDRALTTRTWLPAVQSGAIWGAAATGAYPGVTIVTALMMFVWAIGRIITSSEPGLVADSTGSRRRSAPVHGALALASAGLVGLLCLLPTYVSFFHEATGVHVRRDPLPRDEAVDNNALDVGALVTSVSPHFASLKLHRTSPPLWPKTDVSSVSLYTGAAVLVLACAALVLAPRSRWHWFLAALGLIWIGIAVGSVLPLRGWLYDLVYPTQFFRHSAMFRLYCVFTVTVLALLGAAQAAATVMTSPASRRRCGAVSVTVAAAACFIYWAVLPADAANLPDAALGQWQIVVAWGGMAGVGALLLMARVRLSVVPVLLVVLASADALFAAALTQHSMFSTAPGDVAWWHGEAQLHERDVDLTRRGLLRTLQACELNPPCTEPNTWGMITKVPALSTYTASTNPFYEMTMGDALLAQTAIGPARIWFAPTVARVDLAPEAFRAFLDRTRALGGIPITVHDEQSMLDPTRRVSAQWKETLEQLPRAERIPVTIERYTADALSATIEAPSAGWLLVTERWARSWRAEVDGRPTRIFGGNFVFRAIEVPQGRHRVEFHYEPVALPWLAATSWLTMLAVAAVSIRAARRQRA
jgi:hypothetical protein